MIKYETIKYNEIPRGHCFTFKDASLVYFEDTQDCDLKRTFHAYKDGNIYRTSIEIHNKDKDFYLCDVYGNYIPYSMIMENRMLKRKVTELENELSIKNIIVNMPTYYLNGRSIID